MKMFSLHQIAILQLLRKELKRKRMRMIIKSFRKALVEQLFKKNPISNGTMYQVSSLQKRVSKKQSSCQLSSLNCSRAAENLGKVFCYMDHPVQVRVSLPKLAPLNVIVLSFPFPHQILWVSGRVSLKNSSKTYSKWQEIWNHQWSLLMRLILFVVKELKVKMNHQEESKQSSWSKWMVAEMIKQECLLWEPQIRHGNLMMLSEEDSRREFTFIYQINNQEPTCSS